MARQNPTFFIGLGGHGSDIVDKLAKQVQNRSDWKDIADLNHFIAIDTNKADLENKTFIPRANQVCISNFNKAGYQMRAFGELHEDADPKLTSWLPHPDDYALRENAGKGAGQVRMESRLGVYYNVAVENNLVNVIERCIQTSMRHNNAFRREDQIMRFFIFGSVAGGTGSGAFLSISYLVQSLVKNGWTPHVTMFLSLPTLFKEKVGALYKNVCVNGYAALKELEFLVRKMGYEKDPSYPYRFSGEVADGIVNTSPSGLICIIDRPNKIAVSNIPQAIADAAYLLVFTKMLGSVEGELDNFERESKKLELGAYSSRYGTIGSHVLLFPREDIIEYATRRKMVDILKLNLAFSGKYTDLESKIEYDFSVNYDDPKFKRKSDAEQNKEIDEKFLGYIQFRVEEEKRLDVFGMYNSIVGREKVISNQDADEDDYSILPKDVNGPLLGDNKSTLWDEFFNETSEWMNDLDNKINLQITAPENDVSPEHYSISKKVDTMIRQHAETSTISMRDAESKCQDIISGGFFRRLFTKHKVTPIAQRYFLIKLSELGYGVGVDYRPFIPPFQKEDAEELTGTYIFPPKNMSQLQQEWNQKLGAAATQSLFERIFDSDNEKFRGVARTTFMDLDSHWNNARLALRSDYWKKIQHAFRMTVMKMLETFREVGKTAFERLKEEEEKCQKFLQNPASVNPNAQVAQFHIFAEALRDDKKGRRLWDWFYTHKMDDKVSLDPQIINTMIVDGFAQVEEMGQIRSPGANEVVQKIKTSLNRYLQDQLRSHLNQLDMNAEQAVILENQYLVAAENMYKPGEPDSAQIDIFAPTFSSAEREKQLHFVKTDPSCINRVKKLIAEKIARIESEVCVLANVPAEHFSGATPAMDSIYYSLEDSVNTGDANSISLREIIENNFGSQLRKANQENDVDRKRREDDSRSGDDDRIVFLYSQFNLPLFAFENVIKEMEPHYKRERQALREKRAENNWTGYCPSHTEWDWEVDKVPLIDLNPMEMKAANEKRQRLQQVDSFFKGFFFDVLMMLEDGTVNFNSVAGVEKFGENRFDAFQLYQATHPQKFTREDKMEFVKAVSSKWKEATSQIRFYPSVIEQLKEHQNTARIQDRIARKNMLGSVAGYFQDEIEVIQDLINHLEFELKIQGY